MKIVLGGPQTFNQLGYDAQPIGMINLLITRQLCYDNTKLNHRFRSYFYQSAGQTSQLTLAEQIGLGAMHSMQEKDHYRQTFYCFDMRH